MKVRPSRLRSALKSPAFLSVVLAIVLLSSAILIGYLENRPLRVAANQTSANSLSDAGSAANDTEQTRKIRRLHRHRINLATLSARTVRRETLARSVVKRHQRFTASAAPKTEIARSREPQQLSNSGPMNAPATARTSQPPAKTSTPRNTQSSASRNLEPASHPKDPKLTAMMKTTWHVLKKPFKF